MEACFMNKKYQKSFGERIRDLRLAKGMTQKELADIPTLRIQRNLVNYWENDERDIKSGQIIALSNYFGVSCDYILRGVEAENIDFNKHTGLSDEAIKILAEIRYDRETMIKTINLLLTNIEVFESIRNYLMFDLVSVHDDNATDGIIHVKDKNDGNRTYVISTEALQNMFLIELQNRLTKLRYEYKKSFDDSSNTHPFSVLPSM